MGTQVFLRMHTYAYSYIQGFGVNFFCNGLHGFKSRIDGGFYPNYLNQDMHTALTGLAGQVVFNRVKNKLMIKVFELSNNDEDDLTIFIKTYIELAKIRQNQ